MFGDVATQVLVNGLMLVCWSWSVGFVLGRLPDKFERTIQLKLLVLLGLSQMASAPQRMFDFLRTLYRLPPHPASIDPHAPLIASTFYGVIFPLVVLALQAGLPAISGMRYGKQTARLSPTLRAVLMIAAVVAISMMLPRAPGFGLILGVSREQWLWQNLNPMRMLQLFPYWPTLYLVATAFRRYWPHKRLLV